MKKLFISIIASIIALGAHAQVQCEDTCRHVHGIDLSHYQGNVFWETVGDNSKMAYVYLKATEGGTNIDSKYKKNIDLAHRYGMKVGSYHFYRARIPQQRQLENFMAQCRPGELDERSAAHPSEPERYGHQFRHRGGSDRPDLR